MQAYESNSPAERVSEIIRREIASTGPVSFARFMEVALYAPEFGYYERAPIRVGKRGDFYTNVSVGPLFGELLAFQFLEWMDAIGAASRSGLGQRCQIVEAGSHDGQLACDILSFIKRFRPEQYAHLEYLIVEPSAQREYWQREKLGEFAERVRWVRHLAEVHGVCGVIFSNELLDAFPVHRFGWDADGKRWFEWGVIWRDDAFRWARIEREPDESIVPKFPELLSDRLPDGFIAERSVLAEQWWNSAAKALKLGKLLTIDYGFSADEVWMPERSQGTVRAYSGHRVSGDLLANAGEQDLTAHVQFGAIEAIGQASGLMTERFSRQAEFLVSIAEKTFAVESQFGEWTSKRRREFQTLIHPDHLGRAFRVFVQGSGFATDSRHEAAGS